MPLSAELAEKSVQAAIAAIEVYNKPSFSYREEAFSLLMTNAWELLLKAKWMRDGGENPECLHELIPDVKGGRTAKLNRTGAPMTHGLLFLAAKLLADKKSGLEQGCHDNLLALTAIRDNSAHLVNKDLYLAKRIFEVGTASLRNYLLLIDRWMQVDLSKYNFFLMPLSFYHGFQTAEPAAPYALVAHQLLAYLDRLQEEAEADATAVQHVALRLQTELVKGRGDAAIAFRWTDSPNAPAMRISEEDVLRNYPWTYDRLMKELRARFEGFKSGTEFNELKRRLEGESKYCLVRRLSPLNPRTSRQRFYNPNILQEFDKHYKRKI